MVEGRRTTIDLGFDPTAAGTLADRPTKGVRVPSTVVDGAYWRALRTTSGPASVRIIARGSVLELTAWGPGADDAVAMIPPALGSLDQPEELSPRDPAIAALRRRFGHRRLGRSGDLWPGLVPTVLGQKVPTVAAMRSWRELMAALGEPAPGPAPDDLRIEPTPERMAELAYHDLHGFGIERKRAETIIRAAGVIARHPEWARLSAAAARRRMEAIPGVGPWTSAIVVLGSHGDPDSVIVGDYKLPGQVAWTLAGERSADDARMLELLEPYRGQRARVQVLIATAGSRPPRRGPRLAPVDIRRY